VIDGQNIIIGASKIARDITERKLAEERVRLVADRAQVAAGTGKLQPIGLIARRSASNSSVSRGRSR
jgi:hypothetical protein